MERTLLGQSSRALTRFGTVMLLLMTCCLGATRNAWGWGDAGHKIVASIAWHRLPAAERSRLIEWLKHHPRFQEDFLRKLPPELERSDVASEQEWLFEHASVWPDAVRDFKGELRSEYHHAPWHYINTPLFLSTQDERAMQPHLRHLNLSHQRPNAAERDMNVVQVIRFIRSAELEPRLSPGERAIYLCWLIHAVGDIHQPLHATELFTPHLFPKGDNGGNGVRTSQHQDLHALWDTFPGGKVELNAARKRAVELLQDSRLRADGEQAERNLDEVAWMNESYKLAAEVVYDNEVRAHLRQLEQGRHNGELPPFRLSEEYLHRGGLVARQRVVEAGFRLARVLDEMLNRLPR